MPLMLANDDGIHAPGLSALEAALISAGHSVCVVAPDRDCSGASSSLTLDRPLHPIHHADNRISLNGTPADCGHLGVHTFFGDTCERLISGINCGANLGDDVLYSGTVAAAMEGRFLAKTPIAVSLVGKQHFKTAGQILLDILPRLERADLSPFGVININVPDLPYEQIKGIQLTRLGRRMRSESPISATNPRGKQCYWIAASGAAADEESGTDFNAIKQGYVSITPIQMDMTNHRQQKDLTEILGEMLTNPV